MITTIANQIHDAIDDVTTTVERVHHTIADLPFEIIDGEGATITLVDDVRALQAQSIRDVYALVRRINRGVQSVVTELLPR